MPDTIRLLLVTGTRADFGLWLPVLREAAARAPSVRATLLVTAMHLDPRFGDTVREVRESGFEITAEVACTASVDSREAMAASVGKAIASFAPVLGAEPPDWLLVLGDRGEQLAAALCALHLGIPVAHLHGGEVTRGAVDDTVRDLITRIANLHLVANREAADRIRRLGEEPWRIRTVGAPGLDLLRQEAAGDLGRLRAEHGLGVDGPYLIVVYHPETVGPERSAHDVAAVLAAVEQIGWPAVAVFPNADAGSRAIIRRLRRAKGIVALPSLPRPDFVTLLGGAAAIVGNSSSGIIEAPLLGTPAVNVGERQAGRTRGDNVVDVQPITEEIQRGIARAVDPDFRRRLSRTSPYGDGRSASRVLDILADAPRGKRLLGKRVGLPPSDRR